MTANGDQLRPTLKLISLQLMIESELLSIGIFLGKVTLKWSREIFIMDSVL